MTHFFSRTALLAFLTLWMAGNAFATPANITCQTSLKLLTGTETEPAIASAHLLVLDNGGTGSGQCNLSTCDNGFVYIDFQDRALYAALLSIVSKNADNVASPQVWVQYRTEQPQLGLSMNYTSTTDCKLIFVGYHP